MRSCGTLVLSVLIASFAAGCGGGAAQGKSGKPPEAATKENAERPATEKAPRESREPTSHDH